MYICVYIYTAPWLPGSDGQAHETRPTTSLAHDLAKHLGDDAPDDGVFFFWLHEIQYTLENEHFEPRNGVFWKMIFLFNWVTF